MSPSFASGGRLHHPLERPVQVLHDNQAQQPTLPPGSVGEGQPAQLRHHVHRLGGSAAGSGGCGGDAGDAGEEELLR